MTVAGSNFQKVVKFNEFLSFLIEENMENYINLQHKIANNKRFNKLIIEIKNRAAYEMLQQLNIRKKVKNYRH